MNTWHTLPESYQQRVYENSLATVKRQIQQVENPTAAMVISLAAASCVNAIRLDYVTSEVALDEPEIGSTYPNIPIMINCMEDKLHLGRPGGSGNYKDEDNESNKRGGIPTASLPRRPATELQRFVQDTSGLDGYEGGHGDDVDVDADKEEKATQADDGSRQNEED
jgi:hypothetical protein